MIDDPEQVATVIVQSTTERVQRSQADSSSLTVKSLMRVASRAGWCVVAANAPRGHEGRGGRAVDRLRMMSACPAWRRLVDQVEEDPPHRPAVEVGAQRVPSGTGTIRSRSVTAAIPHQSGDRQPVVVDHGGEVSGSPLRRPTSS
jgi:hypothetical protein